MIAQFIAAYLVAVAFLLLLAAAAMYNAELQSRYYGRHVGVYIGHHR